MVRRPPPARDFLRVLAGGKESPELRIAVGVASCIAGSSRSASRSMRQLLLPIDPGDPADRAHRDGRWRDAPVIPGLGIKPLRHVLADVLAWRSRTGADEVGTEEPGARFHGVPTFQRGIPVPASDLHALAIDPRGTADAPLDEDELETWLRACLALDWWRPGECRWAASESAVLMPTLALLHPLAAGLGTGRDTQAPLLALGPDWAVRLTAGQVRTVHVDAVRRLRQAGWEAPDPVPVIRGNGHSSADVLGSGTAIAAALVPRCVNPQQLFERFAIKINKEQADRDDEASAHVQEVINNPELTKELS